LAKVAREQPISGEIAERHIPDYRFLRQKEPGRAAA
jgi:hypothetical protein